MKYHKDGFVQESVAALLALGLGLTVLTVVYVFGANVAGKIFGQFEDDIAEISDGNVQAYVQQTSESGFQALADTADFTPTVAIVIMVAIALSIFIGVLYSRVGGSMGVGGNSGAL